MARLSVVKTSLEENIYKEIERILPKAS